MNNTGSMLAAVWRIAIPYFRSEDKWAGRALLAAVVIIELATVAIDVLLNQWRNRFYNALQDYNWDSFVYELIYFTVIVMIFVGIAVYQLYLNQWLQIRWRKWMTQHYLGEWLNDATQYRMQLQGDVADNPDQRITDDVKDFIDRTLVIGLGLLNSVVTLISFIVILWGLSDTAPFHLFGREFSIPGYLVWSALIYAIIGTWLTHMIGKPLVGLDFRQQRYEADFRFNLVRIRENSEQIALLRGEGAERERLMGKFGQVVENWMGIMSRTKKITLFTASYSQASQILPYMLLAPAYFAKRTQLGGLMQAASAFLSVQGALSFFITAYRALAEWQAITLRLDGFEANIATAKLLAADRGSIQTVAHPDNGVIELQDLLVRLPNGAPLVDGSGFSFRPGESTLVTGPSGAGKSSLFRAVAGIWPFGRGVIDVPADATLLMLPQRPYFPVGKLSTAVAYPSLETDFSADQIRDAVAAVGLPALAERLEEEEHWNRMLSLGEQQRLGLARALLQKPQFLFLDEATASLDEPSEAAIYRLIEQRLPQTTVVSIGHRSTLGEFHQRSIALVRSGESYALEDAPKAS